MEGIKLWRSFLLLKIPNQIIVGTRRKKTRADFVDNTKNSLAIVIGVSQAFTCGEILGGGGGGGVG